MASMEPQLEGCGKAIASTPTRLDAALQWSRNLRVAESATARTEGAISVTLQWSRNLRVAESGIMNQVWIAKSFASMEPQLEGCGKLADELAASHKGLLQWSRNLRVAESSATAT